MQQALLFLLALFILHPVNAQYEEEDFIHFTVREGLSENYITCLAQDEWGYMWIGTDIGLNRFDGHSFKNFFQGTKTLPLLSGTIIKLKLFGAQQLGIISRGGFQMLNTKDLSVKNYIIPDTTAFSVYRNRGWDAVEMPEQSYAVTTASGFYVFDASGKLNFRHDAYQLKDIGQKRILYGRDIFRLNDTEYVAFINGDGLAYFNAEKKQFHEISKEEKEWASFYPAAQKNNFGWISRYQLSRDAFIFMQFGQNNILYYDKASNKTVISPLELAPTEFSWESKVTMLNDSIFVVNGGYSGFYQFHINRMTGKITTDSKKKLAEHKIQCLYLDKDKRLWAGTAKGLLQQKLFAPVFKSFSYKPTASDTFTGGLSCAFRHKDKLYIGRSSLYKGLVITDAASGKATKEIEFYGKNTPWNEIRSIQMYHWDTLWIGTTSGVVWFDTKTQQYGKLSGAKEVVSSMEGINVLTPAGKDGYAWMCGALKGVVARYHIASRNFTFFTSKSRPVLPFDKVKSIVYDAFGDVWIGGHSLARWNTKKQLFDTLISVYGGPNKYEEDILTLVADEKGSLWLHNAFNGLLEYRIKEKKFVSYTMKDGLPSDVFYGFSPVINNQLWMAGHNQLTGFNTVTKKIVVYDYQDGLPEDKPSGRYLYYDASSAKLNLFNQHVLATISLPEPPITDYSSDLLIEALIVNNEKHYFNPVSGLRLKPDENNISLHFSIVNYESGNHYQFAYKLNEKDNWTALNAYRNINLTRLSPGKYTIWLKATGKSGVEKLQQISFFIAAPFWKTAWFLAAVCLLFVSLIYFLYRYRTRQIRQKANIDKLLAQTEMKALHAQMNPHFIFNSLNSIREMILNKENKEASHFLSKFAHLIRVTLDQSRQSFISLRNTIDYLQRYIEMEQIRNSHFTCLLLADEALDLDETVLPPMLIQPFIENALWHGTTSTEKKINIKINFKKQESQLVCIVDDDGIGVAQSLKNKKEKDSFMHESVGIANIKNRVQLLNEKYNMQCSIHIEDKSRIAGCEGKGTLVTLQLPIEIKGYE